MTRAYPSAMDNRVISLLIAAVFVLFQVLSSAVLAQGDGDHGHHAATSHGDVTVCDEAVDCLAGHPATCAIHCHTPGLIADVVPDLGVAVRSVMATATPIDLLPSGLTPPPGDHPPRFRLV